MGTATTSSTGGAGASTTGGAGASTACGATLLGPAPSTPRRGDGGWLCRRGASGEAWRPRRTGLQRRPRRASCRRLRTAEAKMRPHPLPLTALRRARGPRRSKTLRRCPW
ncbi:hypothetical protein PVAP13_9NG191538 [Panicum virgatum]|uniref:Uncharacterized protein n=1 Tax=Panicum virgatum TaxID=38727 RepID=A0A8T0MHT5_PANVG|nr:hypothetical protein PVAP13_9NG191538 [Panicum virgatum]